MPSSENLPQRIAALEEAFVIASHAIDALRTNVTMLNTALMTVIDDQRPDDPAQADEWFDRLLQVALANVELRSGATLDAIWRDHGPDAEMIASEAEEREAVAAALASFFTALKRPQGSVE